MLAMLFATYVIHEGWPYEDVPNPLRDDVDKILIAEGKGHLIKR